MTTEWFLFDSETGKILAVIAAVIFLFIFSSTAWLILTEKSQKQIRIFGTSVILAVVALSFISTVLYYWHYYYRKS